MGFRYYNNRDVRPIKAPPWTTYTINTRIANPVIILWTIFSRQYTANSLRTPSSHVTVQKHKLIRNKYSHPSIYTPHGTRRYHPHKKRVNTTYHRRRPHIIRRKRTLGQLTSANASTRMNALIDLGTTPLFFATSNFGTHATTHTTSPPTFIAMRYAHHLPKTHQIPNTQMNIPHLLMVADLQKGTLTHETSTKKSYVDNGTTSQTQRKNLRRRSPPPKYLKILRKTTPITLPRHYLLRLLLHIIS